MYSFFALHFALMCDWREWVSWSKNSMKAHTHTHTLYQEILSWNRNNGRHSWYSKLTPDKCPFIHEYSEAETAFSWQKWVKRDVLKQSPSFIYNILNCNAKLLLITSGHLFNKENKHELFWKLKWIIQIFIYIYINVYSQQCYVCMFFFCGLMRKVDENQEIKHSRFNLISTA